MQQFIFWKKYWLEVWDLYNLICYYYWWCIDCYLILIVIWCWFVDYYLMLICYYYYNTVHISFYLEVISDFKSIIFTLLYTGAFSLWSKDAGVLNDVVAQKRLGVRGMTLSIGEWVILYMMIINLSLPASAAGQTASCFLLRHSFACEMKYRIMSDGKLMLWWW